ncbi:isochorismatase family protein [Natrialba sp. INN-245]|uniref:isochorismatase family protein n=1 Tax=Natrialba sp. INN-245 TaxID=2690967 RepID=UPI00130F8444|nr:isochorismatase family protein [Natrialba sp. INN-245]MWV38483.1 isochorismatase family protein [Natrialba sp. INN-245]
MYIPELVPEDDKEVLLEKAGYAGSVGFGETPAVLIVDMTNAFVEDDYPNGYAETGKPAVEAISRLMDDARKHGIRGYYAKAKTEGSPVELGRWTESTGLGEDDQGHEPTDDNPDELADGIEPGPQDVVIDEKYKPSMFFGTQLESMLSYDGVDTLIVTGMTTSGCVRATVVDAFSYNYRIIVPEECVADRSQISHETTLFDIDMKYGDVRPLDDVLEQL